MSNRSVLELQRQWWTRTNTRPLVGLFAPVDIPCTGMDLEVPPSAIAERKRRNAAALSVVGGDKLAVACVNFGPAFVPSLAGAGFHCDANTSWSVPVADRIQDVRVRPFDPGHPRFQAYVARLEPLLASWSWDTFLPGLADYLGPLDILAGMLGAERLALAMLDDPGDVRRHAMDAAEFLRDMLAHELALHRQAGMTEGCTDVFSTWLPGRGVRYSEDVSALVGEVHFREVFLEANAAWIAGLDSAFLHVHSAALPCLPAILDMPGLGAVEISNDPNGPRLPALIAAARRVQAAGKPLQISNWEHPLDDDEIRRIVTDLAPAGLCVTLQASSLSEARRLYALVFRELGGASSF